MSNLRDELGQELSDAIAENPDADFCDAREIDRLIAALMPAILETRSCRACLGYCARCSAEVYDGNA